MKYKELVEEWMEEKKHYVKESTYALYTYEMRSYILPMLGEIELADITEEVLQDCTFQWQEMPSNDGKSRKKQCDTKLDCACKADIELCCAQRISDTI